MTLFSLFILTLTLLLGACSFSPPLPKQPDESERIPINKTYPPELEQN